MMSSSQTAHSIACSARICSMWSTFELCKAFTSVTCQPFETLTADSCSIRLNFYRRLG